MAELWELLAHVAECLSAIAVIVGLIGIWFQLRDGNRATLSAAYQGMVGNSFTLIQNVLNDENLLKAIGARVLPGRPEDEVRWHFMALAVLRHYENLFVQYKLRAIDQSRWSGYRELLTWYLHAPAMRAWWSATPHATWFSPDFAAEISDLLKTTTPAPQRGASATS